MPHTLPPRKSGNLPKHSCAYIKWGELVRTRGKFDSVNQLENLPLHARVGGTELAGMAGSDWFGTKRNLTRSTPVRHNGHAPLARGLAFQNPERIEAHLTIPGRAARIPGQ